MFGANRMRMRRVGVYTSIAVLVPYLSVCVYLIVITGINWCVA